MNSPKSGWQTSEFWISMVLQFLTLLVVLGVVHVEDRATLADALTAAVTAIFSLITSAAVVISYIIGRVKLKQKS